MSRVKKVTVVVTGEPKELVEVCESLAMDGVEFSFKAWEVKAKFSSYAQANSFTSKVLAFTKMHAEIKE